MNDDLRELLVRHLPGYQVRSVAKLGEGWDNVVHEVNGELVVRRSRDADVARRSATTRREVELLEAVAELPGEPLEDLAYGFRTGQRRYADAGLAHLPRTFAPDR